MTEPNPALASLLAQAATGPHRAERLGRAETLAGDDPEALRLVAAALWRAGLLERCAAVLTRTLEVLANRPNFVTSAEEVLIMTQLGAARLRLGFLDDALVVLHRALEQGDNGYTALQLGNALRYRGDFEEAGTHLTRAYHAAKAERDGELAIAALCAAGEVALATGGGLPAVERFGEALGITELMTGGRRELLTVAPLAGLAQAHAGWKNPAKGRSLAERAWGRASAGGDRVLEARAGLALGVVTGAAAVLARAETTAAAAPHRPLAAQILVARAELGHDPELIAAATAWTADLGMRGESARLSARAAER